VRFGRSVAITYASQVLVIAFGMGSSVITARYLGPEGKGILATVLAAAALAAQFGNLGLQASAVYHIGHNPSVARAMASFLTLVALVVGLVCVGVLLIAGHLQLLPGVPPTCWVIFFGVPFQLVAFFLRHVLLARGRVLEFNLFDVCNSSLFLVCTLLLLVLVRAELHYYLLSLVGAAVLVAALAAVLTFGTVPVDSEMDRRLLRDLLHYGLRNYVACLFGFLLTRCDVLLLNYFRPSAEVGTYSIAVGLRSLMVLLPTSVGVMLFPKIARAESEGYGLTARVLRHVTTMMVAIVLLAGLLARPIIVGIYGPAYLDSVLPFWLLLPGALFLAMISTINNDLAGRGLPTVCITGAGAAFALNAALNVLLIPRLGAAGAAVSSSASYVLWFLIISRYALRTQGATVRECFWPRFAEFRDMALNWRGSLVR